MNDSRLDSQVRFALEIDRLKTVYRRNVLVADPQRAENDAEHCWHVSVLAMVLGEYAPAGTDLNKVVRMLLVHDLVEVYAGDTYCYDQSAVAGQHDREVCAADRLFALLPPDQAKEFRTLWDEFEARQTHEARFAAALDRVQPVLLNYHSQGRSWRHHGVTLAQAMTRNCVIAEGSPRLWDYIRGLLEDAAEKGYLA